ncbi:carboxymuconolactone decarboxylase family protein [Streptomyces sp. BE303]|uniref:carboxymuconolactone decarboxylase family protein n=1 Tax=Streptomyces sp. BE303 TaxID=3002528 RepID=UPI002E7716D1|nr:carboxymuconolactone decarboxylase family protein [Streptomyces sp. BE303]MED7951968.1 carboxymuconolactone decarboxylase family protein [Streptomyces sp. BE303]
MDLADPVLAGPTATGPTATGSVPADVTAAGLVPAPFDRAAGYALLDRLADPRTRTGTLGPLDELAPGFPDWIVTTLFGGTYQRPGLALRDRQVANLAALTALGGVEPQLADHVRNSLRIGLTREEITEVLVHLAPYVGVPKALAGLRVAAATFAEADDEADEETGADDAAAAGAGAP